MALSLVLALAIALVPTSSLRNARKMSATQAASFQLHKLCLNNNLTLPTMQIITAVASKVDTCDSLILERSAGVPGGIK